MPEMHGSVVTIMFVQVTETAENEREIPVVSCRLEEHQRFLRDHLKYFHGKLLEIRIGELYAYFPDATLAFNAAISLQQIMSQFNLRIGLHAGEVLFRQGRLQSADVNLASRLPYYARAGGICLSRTVYQYLNASERQRLVTLGTHYLKNFDTRMSLYAYLPDGQASRSRGREMRRQFFASLNRYWQKRSARYTLLVSLTGLIAVFIWAQNMISSTQARDVINLYVPAFVNQAQDNESVVHLEGIEMAVRSRLSGAHDVFDLVLMSDRSHARTKLLVKLHQASGNINAEYIISSLPTGLILASGRVEQGGSSIFHLQDSLSNHVLQDLEKLKMTNPSLASETARTKLDGILVDR
ncbi:MAG TPA: adenylate/guanylate cyclase domain-containing protein [Gammaproteobacteria bacterium]|nr:adenylate/guanylate cyclase domain-containing protein [Gammaproteobacteria bacterium]